MQKALHHYNTSKKVSVSGIFSSNLLMLVLQALELWLAIKKDKSAEERAEVEDLVDVLIETIGALEVELQELKEEKVS